jgi:hypothetical protein
LQTGENIFENAVYEDLTNIASNPERCKQFVDRHFGAVKVVQERKVVQLEMPFDTCLLTNEEVGR